MSDSITEPTLPLEIPKQARQRIEHKTRVVSRSNEKQLQLPWTDAPYQESDEPTAAVSVAAPEAAKPSVEVAEYEVARRAYPLAYDPNGPVGPALALLKEVQEHTDAMTKAYGEADIETIGSRLPIVARLLGEAYPSTEFNPALGAAVSFLRRATLLASADQCGFDGLMGLAKAARRLAEHPLINLEDSADLVLDLESLGWAGADPDVAEFVSTLFGDAQVEAAPAHAQSSDYPKGTVE